MDTGLRSLLAELYAFGRQNDETKTVRAERMLNITPETGELLRMVVIAGNLRRVLELGTSNGYSTLWLADACRQIGGKVVTVEHNPAKHALALANFRRAGLEDWITARLGDIGEALNNAGEFDLVFLDSERTDYGGWWPRLQAAPRPGGLLVVDNATSHPQEMAPFVQVLEETPGFSRVLVPLGNGELVILKEQA